MFTRDSNFEYNLKVVESFPTVRFVSRKKTEQKEGRRGPNRIFHRFASQKISRSFFNRKAFPPSLTTLGKRSNESSEYLIFRREVSHAASGTRMYHDITGIKRRDSSSCLIVGIL